MQSERLSVITLHEWALGKKEQNTGEEQTGEEKAGNRSGREVKQNKEEEKDERKVKAGNRKERK